MQAADWSNTSTQPLDRLWSLTQDAWGQADLSKALPEGMQLLARVDGEIVAFDPRAEKRPIYIADTDDRSMTGALSRVARGVIVFEPPLARAKEVATYLCAQIPDGLQRMSEMRVVYQTSQGAFVYDAADPLLEQDIAADVRTFVLLTVRYRCKFVSASPDKIVGKLSTLRIRWVDELHLQVGDHSLPLPSFQHSAVLVSSGGGDTILAPKMTKGSDRELLVLAPALGEVVGSRLLASDALYAVAARMLQTGKGATAQGLAEALDLAHDDVLAAMQDSRTIIGALLHVTRPFIRLWCGPPAMEELLDKHRPTNEADLIAASDNHSAIPVSGRRLVEACRSGSVENAALDLHVDLAALNAVLQELGAPYRPIDRTAHHEEAFGRYLLRQQARIRESIREAYRDDFMAGDLSHYVTARDAPAPIVPAGTGLCLLRSESTDWASWLMDWLAKGGVSALVEVPEARATLEVVRETNQKFLKALAPTARLLVIKKAETEAAVAQTWRDPEGLEGRLLAIASAQGWTDFDRLDETAILTWLARARLWPEDWPKSLVASDHGLTAEDLDALREAERKARQALITPPRMLEFTGGQYIVGETSLASLTDHIAELVNDNAALLASSSNTMKGKPIVLPKRTSGGTGGGGGYGSGTDRMTDEEKSVIGYFGEIIAFGWLKAKFGRNRVIDHGCWKSNYRRHACGEPGDDSLGYDFEIASGKATWFFEVKATASADPRDCRMIELGSTEVAKAEVCRAENRLHYRILHVVNALKPDQASLRVLPNPRSEEGKAFYTEQMTAGVRLYFPPQ